MGLWPASLCLTSFAGFSIDTGKCSSSSCAFWEFSESCLQVFVHHGSLNKDSLREMRTKLDCVCVCSHVCVCMDMGSHMCAWVHMCVHVYLECSCTCVYVCVQGAETDGVCSS